MPISDLQFADNYMMVTLQEAMPTDVNHFENTRLKPRLFHSSPDRLTIQTMTSGLTMKTWSLPQNLSTVLDSILSADDGLFQGNTIQYNNRSNSDCLWEAYGLDFGLMKYLPIAPSLQSCRFHSPLYSSETSDYLQTSRHWRDYTNL